MQTSKITEIIESLESILCYNFKNLDNISVALNHPGSRKYNHSFTKKFERLEFLGDRVLGLALASLIYEKFPSDSEGELAVRISILAGTDFLIDLSKRTGLISCFSIPKGMFVSKNKTSSSIADMVEAVIGSIFLDSDFKSARKVIIHLWGKDLTKVIYKIKDSKTRLQEFAQSRFNNLPKYQIKKMSGEAHDPIFEVEVKVNDLIATGFGNSKKSAEHDAADKLIEKLQK